MKLNVITMSLIATIALVGCGDSSTSDEDTQGNTDSQTLSANGSSTTGTDSQNSDNNSNSNHQTDDSTSPTVRPSIDGSQGGGNPSSDNDNSNPNSNQIKDTTPPVITISGGNPLEIIQGKTFTDPSATATDNIDGEITVTSSGTVDTSTIGEYTITYTAKDKAGNEATATRIVQIKAPISNDKTAPVITISGENPLSIFQGETFSDPGATATDNIDGEVAVTPSGSVDMSIVGEYTITYTATDQAGNESTATRTVKVKSAEVIWNVSTVTEFRQALEDASANGENDKIVLSAGTYKTTEDGLGTFEFNDNEEFDLTIESAEGLSRDDVLLNGDHSTQVFNFNNTQDSTLIFRGISIVDGNSTTNGGGVYTNHNIKIENCDITNNNSNGNGGGFYSQTTAIISNSIISENHANNSGGGFDSYGMTTITNSIVSNNSSYDNGGFGSYGQTIVKDSTINKNYANHNQGGFGSHTKTTIINSNISKNKSDGAVAGFGSNGATVVTNSTISENNSSSGYGGFWSNGTTKVIDSIISNNIANGDGGGFNSNSATTVINSTIINNQGKNIGGGFISDGFTLINNSKISNNNAVNQGGGFYTSDTIIVTNSILANNSAIYGASLYSAPYGGYPYPNYNSYLSSNNFIGNSSSIHAQGVFVNNIFNNNGDTDINLIGNSKIYNNYIDYNKIEENSNNVIKKQNLQPSAVGDVHLNNDNETLASNSPVIDKGLNPSSATYKKIIDNDDIYNQMIQLLKTDKVGNRRVHNETIDMGAVEYGSSK